MAAPNQATQFWPASMRQSKDMRDLFRLHADRVRKDMRRLGANVYNRWLPEYETVPLMLHPDERLLGVVFGRYRQVSLGSASGVLVGRGVLVATDRRVLFLDRKPVFLRCDEVPLYLISGITYSHVGFIGHVTLHTRTGDYDLRTFNQKAARNFVEAVELLTFVPESLAEAKPM